MNLPELAETAESVSQQAKTLLPWLPDPYTCPSCGVYCDASRTYDPQQAAFYPNGMAPSWECPECGSEFRRDTV